ncbi:MAG: general secretion pathway protein GspF [Gammaproteobacteria bacterium]|nr:MAG: general secretion pathway protein GspF [Gammaproteobacteria bacterium]
MSRRKKIIGLNDPLRHANHARPMTRRQFVAQGFCSGLATVAAPSILGLFADPRQAHASLSSDLNALKDSCGIAVAGAGKIPFICFDLVGGANIAGSNVLVGGRGGQEDFLTNAGYSRLGIPEDKVPPVVDADNGQSENINRDLGLAFHSDSAFLRGILERVSDATAANVNGAVIPARSDNDTGNNPHNPMYGIYNAGADGSLLSLIGSRSSVSGGNSMAPSKWLDVSLAPTKVDRVSDVTGLVDVGDLVGLLNQSDAVAVMESIQRISARKLGRVQTEVTTDEVIKDLVNCGYVKSADIADRFGNPATLNPEEDALIVGSSGIFTQEEFDGEGEFRKTASVMKLVNQGYAGAGTITMGGFDYHTGDRSTGEQRDFRAGRCMGACLEYAARLGVPVMLYVFSDGSVASNGSIDDSVLGRGKGVWSGDNSSTAASFFLVYDPNGRPTLLGSDPAQQARHQQIGSMSADAAVDRSSSPAANNVNLLTDMVLLNYMALHGEADNFSNIPNVELTGSASSFDSWTAFEPIVSGTIDPVTPPVVE